MRSINVSASNTPGLSRTWDHALLLALRLLCITIMVALLMMHVRSVRVFRWEQAVSGGVLVTFTVAAVGLALCAGIEECGAKVLQLGLRSVYGIRLLIIATFVILMSLRFRSLSVMRSLLYQAMPRFLVVGNSAIMISLAMCVGSGRCGFNAMKVYISGVGSVILALNAATIWRRWRYAGDMTRVVAELLGAMGVPLRRQILTKAILSAVAALILLIDLIWTLLQYHKTHLQ